MTTRTFAADDAPAPAPALRRVADADVVVRPFPGGLAVAAHVHRGALFWTQIEPADIARLGLPDDGVGLLELKDALLRRVDTLAAEQVGGARRRPPRWATR